jgi:arabinofuranosyltransferase
MMIDDGLIYARFFQNAFDGNGLVFNPGEWVNSLSSPLFSYVMLGVVWLLHGHVLLAEHLIYGLALLGACALAESVMPFAGIAVATTAYFYRIMGMESSLFLLLLMLTVVVYTRRRYRWLPLLLVLLSLTRFEGALLVPVVAFLLWRERSLPRLSAFLPALVVVAEYLLVNHHLYHSWLPQTALSKIGQGFSGYWGRWPGGFTHAKYWAFTNPNAAFFYTIYVVPLAAYFSFKGWQSLRGSRLNAIVLPFYIALFAFYLLFNLPAYAWYYAPFIFFAIVYAVKGVPESRVSFTVFLAVLSLAAITNIFVVKAYSPKWDYINVAEWMNANIPQNASVEAVEIGHIGWYTHRRVIDIIGLTYPKNADHIAHRDDTSWLNEDQPDYIVMHSPAAPMESIAVSNPNYEMVGYHSGSVYLLQKKPGPWIFVKPPCKSLNSFNQCD